MHGQVIQVTDPGLPSVFTVRETKIVETAMNLIEERLLRDRPIFNRSSELERYLILRFAGQLHEQFHALYLDNSYRLLAAKTEFFGRPNHCKTDIRRIVLHAITLGAVHVVFAHNHPGDTPEPSKDDLALTKFYENILSQLSINLLESFVVTSRSITSIKAVYKRLAEEELGRQKFELECRRAVRRSKIALTKARKRAPPEGGDILINQYSTIKAENPGALLFYRMGDFYELFFDDAKIAAAALGIVLTTRGKHDGLKIPLCGIPVQRAEDCLNQLIRQGHSVAICEQVEDQDEAQQRGASVIRRLVVRIVSPGVSVPAAPYAWTYNTGDAI